MPKVKWIVSRTTGCTIVMPWLSVLPIIVAKSVDTCQPALTAQADMCRYFLQMPEPPIHRAWLTPCNLRGS